MSTTTTTTNTVDFDLARFTRAAEERDAHTQLSMYGADAVVSIVDKINQPGAPRVLHGREEIAAWLQDMFGRDMTHHVRQAVSGESGAAFTLACRYPDGTNVLCVTVIGVADGAIAEQTVLQAWDER